MKRYIILTVAIASVTAYGVGPRSSWFGPQESPVEAPKTSLQTAQELGNAAVTKAYEAGAATVGAAKQIPGYAAQGAQYAGQGLYAGGRRASQFASTYGVQPVGRFVRGAYQRAPSILPRKVTYEPGYYIQEDYEGGPMFRQGMMRTERPYGLGDVRQYATETGRSLYSKLPSMPKWPRKVTYEPGFVQGEYDYDTGVPLMQQGTVRAERPYGIGEYAMETGRSLYSKLPSAPSQVTYERGRVWEPSDEPMTHRLEQPQSWGSYLTGKNERSLRGDVYGIGKNIYEGGSRVASGVASKLKRTPAPAPVKQQESYTW